MMSDKLHVFHARVVCPATKEHWRIGGGGLWGRGKCTVKLILCKEDPVWIDMHVSLFMPQHSRWGSHRDGENEGTWPT